MSHSQAKENAACLLLIAFLNAQAKPSRLVTCRYRHLMLDLLQLIPNSKKDAKLDTKSQRGVINEVADLKVGV